MAKIDWAAVVEGVGSFFNGLKSLVDWLGGARNAPQELPRIASVLAELRNLSRAEVEETTSRNAKFLLESGQARGFA